MYLQVQLGIISLGSVTFLPPQVLPLHLPLPLLLYLPHVPVISSHLKALSLNRLTWTVNGAITHSERYSHYYLDQAPRNEELLLPHIRKGNYVMLYGARASGKTTRAFRAMEQLEDYCC